MLFFVSIKSFLVFIFCFPVYNKIAYILKKDTTTIKKISVNKNRDFIFENYYKRIGLSMKNSYFSMKQKKNVQLFVAKFKKK